MNKVSSSPLISVKNLSISFIKKNDIVKVVNNISFDLLKNEVLGIVGESGSGKSVTALSILKLLPKKKTISKGEVIYNNTNLLELNETRIRQVRKKRYIYNISRAHVCAKSNHEMCRSTSGMF